MVQTAPANVMEIHIAPASTHEPVVATTRLATATTDSAITTVALVPRRLFIGPAAGRGLLARGRGDLDPGEQPRRQHEGCGIQRERDARPVREQQRSERGPGELIGHDDGALERAVGILEPLLRDHRRQHGEGRVVREHLMVLTSNKS